MEKKILVAYATNAGSTTEVAEAVGETLGQAGAQVEVLPIKAVEDVTAYDAAVVGGPMILGWHRGAQKFLKKHRQALSQVPVAYFMTAMRLTPFAGEALSGIPIYQDPRVVQPPQDSNKLSFKERFTTVESYLKPALEKAPQVKPVGVGFFAGKLDYRQLNILHMLFVMLVVGAQPGDRRNWTAIREWAAGLAPALLGA